LARKGSRWSRSGTNSASLQLAVIYCIPQPDEILPEFGSSIDRLALLRIPFALERHRLAVGAFPEKLDNLVPRFLPAVPTGIFDGQSLQLRKIREGDYEIYFFGRDARDNQGTRDDISLKISTR
jgi:hypothetical protein